MPAFIDMTGQRFGHWSVSARANGRTWLCKCDCGTRAPVDGATLRNGRSTSCGCMRQNNLRHGMARKGRVSSEWNIWNNMRHRCTDQKHKSWKNYGGRGISVCDRWMEFENFYADMGPRPSQNHSIDRRDNDGPYSPENCRWATRREQSRNTTRNRKLYFDGQSLTLVEWSERIGIDADTIGMRLKDGWTIERALATSLLKNQHG